MPTREKVRSDAVNFPNDIRDVYSVSLFFICSYPVLFSTESSVGARTILNLIFHEKHHRDKIQSVSLAQSTTNFEIEWKGTRIIYLLSHLENEKFTIYEKTLFFT